MVCNALGALHTSDAASTISRTMPADVQRGRYLVQIASCNDCHTPGHSTTNGKVDKKLWLTGDTLGRWGTTYASI